ncbi:MAG: hypothetical protein J3K34DRAFT_402560 [Monoraphidium minutum]|nr:MAG: hypothetical protein J3K34DRAFT_402560 [Monoraphidium minutum]
MRLMAARDIRNVPVVDDRAMAGVLTIEDVVRALLRDGSEEVAALRHFIAGTSPHGLA